jgi:hypothetical protein
MKTSIYVKTLEELHHLAHLHPTATLPTGLDEVQHLHPTATLPTGLDEVQLTQTAQLQSYVSSRKGICDGREGAQITITLTFKVVLIPIVRGSDSQPAIHLTPPHHQHDSRGTQQ